MFTRGPAPVIDGARFTARLRNGITLGALMCWQGGAASACAVRPARPHARRQLTLSGGGRHDGRQGQDGEDGGLHNKRAAA